MFHTAQVVALVFKTNFAASTNYTMSMSTEIKLFSIPNLITCCNIFCGAIATVLAFQGYDYLVYATLFIYLGAFFDFFDGMAARALKSFSAIGKDLDSLADMVSFGVAPAMVVFSLMRHALLGSSLVPSKGMLVLTVVMLAIPLLNVVFSGLRLAKFNVDTRQTTSFIGLPTPANAMLLSSFPVVLHFYPTVIAYQHIFLNPIFLACICLLECYLLVSEIPMFSLKFKSLGFAENKLRFVFLAVVLAEIVLMQLAALPFIILTYIVFSFIGNLSGKKADGQAEHA